MSQSDGPTPGDLRKRLAARGTRLNRGLGASAVHEMASAQQITLDPLVAGLYAEFDGFPDGVLDSGSALHLWPLARVLSEEGGSGSRRKFADFLIGSNEYTFDLSNANAPVLDSEDDSVLSSSFRGFLVGLVEGEFDFD